MDHDPAQRREAYRQAFEGFDPARIARYGEKDVERLMADPGIIRNRAKIEATIKNAQASLAVSTEREASRAVPLAIRGRRAADQPAGRRLKEVPPRRRSPRR